MHRVAARSVPWSARDHHHALHIHHCLSTIIASSRWTTGDTILLFHDHHKIMNFLLDQRRLFLVIAVLKLFTDASSLGDNDVPPTARRRRVYFGSMDSLLTSSPSRSGGLKEGDIYSISNAVRRNKRRKVAEEGDVEEEESRDNKLWPPWPFNLLTQRGSKKSNNGHDNIYNKRNSIILFWSYFGQRMLITKRQLQHGKSQFRMVTCFHSSVFSLF